MLYMASLEKQLAEEKENKMELAKQLKAAYEMISLLNCCTGSCNSCVFVAEKNCNRLEYKWNLSDEVRASLVALGLLKEEVEC